MVWRHQHPQGKELLRTLRVYKLLDLALAPRLPVIAFPSSRIFLWLALSSFGMSLHRYRIEPQEMHLTPSRVLSLPMLEDTTIIILRNLIDPHRTPSARVGVTEEVFRGLPALSL